MISRLRVRVLTGAILLGLGIGLWSPLTAQAQVVDTGLQAVGEVTSLTATDPRVIATRIINISLSLLSFILLGVILYAGFLWMTAGGDEKQVQKAKDMIRNGIIGVIIILTSWMIVTFVINKLLGAVGGNGGGGGPGGSGGVGTGDIGNGGAGALGFQVRAITPSGVVPLRNVEVRFIFSREVRANTVTSSIQIVRAGDGVIVTGSLQIEGSMVTFVPSATCPAPNGTRRCFQGNTEFIARVDRSLRSSIGQTLACGGLAPACEIRFTTGDIVDVAPPVVSIFAPFSGQGVPSNDLVRIQTRATDDTGISYIESFADGRSLGTAVASATSSDRFLDGVLVWDTRGVVTGTHQLLSRARDLDSNQSTSTPVTVVVRPRHCFNEIQDEGETGLNCGGGCGGCAGDVCREAADCGGGVCGPAGTCVEQPIITGVTPLNGAPGTYVTIQGVNFGVSAGQVLFGGRRALAPDACVAAGASLWTQTQTVVQVPMGAATGTVQIVNRNALSDTTTDERGPRIGEFAINNRIYPGLCAIRPGSSRLGSNTRLDVDGVNLGSASDRLSFNDRQFTNFLSWSDRNIGIASPVISPGSYAVQAQVSGVNSNPVFFQLEDRVPSAAPVIDEIEPATGTVGTYITITGRNFGTSGQVYFRTGGSRAFADTNFPAACSNNYWRDTSIIVKVPATIRDGLNVETPLRPGMFDISVFAASESGRKPFEVRAGSPSPGICAIQPMAGPGGTPITVVGEHFGSVPARLAFPVAGGLTADATITSWNDQEIRSAVPLSALSGLVRVTAAGRTSNGVVFSARNCNEEAGICQNGQACCSDGSCAVNGVCRNVASSAQFAWRTSTGRIIANPQVVEACNENDPPSPSPLLTRQGGNDVCVNAQVVALFTTRLDRSTINTRNILITRCTGTTGDPCSTGTPEPVVGAPIEIRTHDQGDYIIFTPGGPGLWRASSTYQVIMKKDIRATALDGGLTMLENRERYGAGNGYAFRFQTKSTDEICQAGSVSVSPHNWTMNQLTETKEYGLSARSSDICVQLNSRTMDWAWSVSDAGRARFMPLADGNDVQTVEGIGATESPIQIRASLLRPVPPRPVTGAGNLSIRIQPPQVQEYGPNCDQACINAALWARFNVALDASSLTHLENGRTVPNVIAKRCVNQSCRAFDQDVAITPEMLRLDTFTAEGATPNALLIVDSGSATILDRERYYKVWVLGGEQGVRSAYGRLPLAGLNETNPVAFSWTFRVRGGTNPVCAVDHVDVIPGQKYENEIGARQLFGARPASAADICHRNGQILNTAGNVTWATSDANVADFARISGNAGSLSLATALPISCTNRCLNAGSQGVAGHMAICGNNRVETVNPQLCHPRSAPNRACQVSDTDCETDTRTPCTLLPENSTGSEECDESSSYCSGQCLWVGQSSIASGGTCGNSVRDRGEQCDAGSVCVGGSTPGRDCSVAPATCGTGGTCMVVNRQGCSTTCLALGSQAGGSTCGNGDIADGETCDDRNQRNGDGCSSDCRIEGSASGITSFCGDGRIDPGESCEVSDQGNTYCRLVDGVKQCVPGTIFQNLCDPVSCLNRGTARGTTAGLCGNLRTDAGEDCDGGQGCSVRCLFVGSSALYSAPSICGDRTVGTGEQCDAPTSAPVMMSRSQLFEITGLREPLAEETRTNGNRMKSDLTARYESRTGNAVYGVNCSFTSELSCQAGTGLTSGGCCAPRPQVSPQYPTGNNACRNTVIYAHFNQSMDKETIERNFIVAKSVVATTCPAGTTPLQDDRPVAHGWRGWIVSMWSRVTQFFGINSAIAQLNPIWCIGGTQGRVTFDTEEDGSTTASFMLSQALEPNTDYQVVLRGETDLTRTHASTRGIRSSRGVVSQGNITWQFRTGADVCVVSSVDIQDTVRQHPYLFYRGGEAHRYISRAISLRNGVQAPIVPIDGLYSWTWQRWTNSNDPVVLVAESSLTPLQTVATTTARNKSGSSLVGSSLLITADRVSTLPTIGRVYAASRLSTVILCENPWIPETAENISLLPRFQDTDFNFVTAYCRDAGLPGVTDDLPNLVINRLPTNTVDANRGVLRQYLFSFADPALRGDGIGVRIIANLLHLSPTDWYLTQGFRGEPQVTTVDGYEALRDGSTLYIGAANTDELMTRADTNIYIISRNPNAGPIATSIFDQMVSNLSFNGNLAAQQQRVCVNATGVQYIDPAGNGLIRCSADWECLRQANDLHCASAKEKIQRDLVRISDFQSMTSKLSETKARTGGYPTLPTGTQLPGFVTSRWAGWQSGLGAALGSTSLPQDPINQYLTCGRCQGSNRLCAQDSECGQNSRCNAVDGRDPSTCWSVAMSTYMCPIYSATNSYSASHVYQYRALANGSRFELGTELEALNANQYRPPLITEAKRCANTGGLCAVDTDCDTVALDGRVVTAPTGSCVALGGRWIYENVCRGQAFGNGQICGDGVIDSRPDSVEVCEVGQQRTAGCSLAGGAQGSIIQVCKSDCLGFVNASGAACQAETLCGNGRVDTKRCTGGIAAGPRFGASCQSNTDCDTNVLCEPVRVPEVCDDGALNGTYGHCTRTCNGYGGTCGDNQVSAGERCDLGAQNGAYCNTAGSCSLGATCGEDCQSRAPSCGDGQVQTPDEECDGNSAQSTSQAVCTTGAVGKACSTPGVRTADCGDTSGLIIGGFSLDGLCGGASDDLSCVGVKKGLYAGGTLDRQACTCPASQDSCDITVSGTTNRCIMYATQRTRSCINPGVTPVVNQCTWTRWSGCQPVSQCGDGVVDTGEQCDDGNRSDNDSCTNSCKTNVCGDHALNVGVEECDNGTAENGAACRTADYGSTCVACTAQCRMTASSGGYCGDDIRQGTEQCDGTALGLNATTLTCQSLGFDYAEAQTAGRDAISCSRTCNFAGCKRCRDERGAQVISAQVIDAQYSGLAVPAARVTLYQRGARITEVFTDNEGNFTINTLSARAECSQYRIVVDSSQNNPKTVGVDESVNGGYWPFESRQFTASDFNSVGIRNEGGKIYLIPRVGRGETLVVHTWSGSLGGRLLLSHLVMPSNRAWDGFTRAPILMSCGTTRPSSTCQRDIHEQDNPGGFQGISNLSAVPYARLFCSGVTSPTSDASCFGINTGPQATRYRLQVPNVGVSVPGIFNYYISDQLSARTPVSSPVSAAFYRQTLSTAYVVTQDRIYTINPPEGTPTACSGKYWHVFSQDAVSGAVTIYTAVNGTTPAGEAYKCGGDLITGEPVGGVASRLPDASWGSTGPTQTYSWLHFGGRFRGQVDAQGRPVLDAQGRQVIVTDYENIDWDVRR